MMLMGCFDRWAVRHVKWIKPLDSLSLDELFQLQQDVGMAIAKKLEVKAVEKRLEVKK